MLTNMPEENKQKTILDILRDSPIQFVLTGSRFFGTARPDSDWDFYTKDDNQTSAFLRNNGFVAVSKGSYADDPNCARVFLWRDKNFNWVENIQEKDVHPDVHVQLVANIQLKNDIQNALKKTNIFSTPCTKSFARDIWKLAYALRTSFVSPKIDEDSRIAKFLVTCGYWNWHDKVTSIRAHFGAELPYDLGTCNFVKLASDFTEPNMEETQRILRSNVQKIIRRASVA